MGCRWYKSRKSPKSQQMLEMYGKKGCWQKGPSRSAGTRVIPASKIPQGSCEGLEFTATTKNGVMRACYARPNCEVKKIKKNGGERVDNLKCVEVRGSGSKAMSDAATTIQRMQRGLSARSRVSALRSGSRGSDPVDVSAAARELLNAMSSKNRPEEEDIPVGMEAVKKDDGSWVIQRRARFNSRPRKGRKSRRGRKSRKRSRKSRRGRKSRRRSRKSRRGRKSRRRSRKSRRGRKSRKGRKSRRRSSKRKSRRRSRKSKCVGAKKSACGRSKKLKGCAWRRKVGCVKKSRRRRSKSSFEAGAMHS